MKAKALPTQAQIKEILHYDPETGVFRWKVSLSNRVKPLSVAGCLNHVGYVQIGVYKKLQLAHRLAWAYMTGEWPEHEVDHIDGIKTNNNWSNLRQATHKQNMENRSLGKNNTSGFRGVAWSERYQKWRAAVGHNKKTIHIGYFDTAEEASKAAAAKRAELFTHDIGRDKANKLI